MAIFCRWELVSGDPESVIAKPMTVAISENKARQLFKEEDPIGKIVNMSNEFNFTITGIFKDIPEQSHIKADFITSFSSIGKLAPNVLTRWGTHCTSIYLKINPTANLTIVKDKIANVWNTESTDIPCTGIHIRSELQAFKNVYLKSGQVVGGLSPINFVIGFAIIAAFILLISCLNFINLSVAIQSKRNVENGMKKLLGANFAIFSRQIFLEICIHLLLALILSFFMVNMSLPFLTSLIDINLAFSIFGNHQLLLFIVSLIVLIIIVCGSLPVLLMFRAKTAGLLKGVSLFSMQNGQAGKPQKNIRNSLVILQFAIGIMLVISSLIVNKQLKLIRQHDAGFNQEQMLVINNNEGDHEKIYTILSEALKQYPEVESITSGSNVPLDGINNWGGAAVVGEERNQMQGCGFISVNYSYLDAIEAEFVEGRNFIEGQSSDIDKLIITEALVKSLNLENPIGKKLENLWDNQAREIVGVVKNIEFYTIHKQSKPIIFFCRRANAMNFHQCIVVKLKSNNLPETIAAIKNNWDNISPDCPMDYFFLDDQFNKNYQSEIQTSTFLNIMTMVAISLCCMGLFGLALFNINGRIKEIGIRKVNGAKVVEILHLLNVDFIKWVLIAFVIASPIAYYAMSKWLQNFAQRTEISWWIFALSCILALGIALLTVSWQTFKAARRNPVEALRYE